MKDCPLGGDGSDAIHLMYLYLIAQQPICTKCKTHTPYPRNGLCPSCEFQQKATLPTKKD